MLYEGDNRFQTGTFGFCRPPIVCGTFFPFLQLSEPFLQLLVERSPCSRLALLKALERQVRLGSHQAQRPSVRASQNACIQAKGAVNPVAAKKTPSQGKGGTVRVVDGLEQRPHLFMVVGMAQFVPLLEVRRPRFVRQTEERQKTGRELHFP